MRTAMPTNCFRMVWWITKVCPVGFWIYVAGFHGTSFSKRFCFTPGLACDWISNAGVQEVERRLRPEPQLRPGRIALVPPRRS